MTNPPDRDIAEDSLAGLKDARQLLLSSQAQFSHPLDAMLAHLVAAVVLAKAIGVSQAEMIEGVLSAYHDLKLSPKVAPRQEGSANVH